MSHCNKYGHNVALSTFVACHNVTLYTALMSHIVLMLHFYDLAIMSHCSVLKHATVWLDGAIPVITCILPTFP
jgi:hypothetical protein